jgi:hypothetical protein
MGFAYQNFDQAHIHFPYKGMNRDIAPYLLPEDNAYYLENFTQDSLGNGTLRYGVKNFVQLSSIDDGFIIRSFPYVASGSIEQLLSYVSVFNIDNTAANISVIGNTVTLTTDRRDLYLNDTMVKIIYTDADQNVVTQKLRIAGRTFVDATGLSFQVPDAVFPLQQAITSISFSVGELHKTDIATKQSIRVFTGLRADCIPRSVPFTQKLVICNGLDPLMQWDGTTASIIYEWVKEKATTFVKVNDFTLQFTCTLNPAKYLQATSIFFNALEFPIQNSNVVGNIVTLTLANLIGNLPQIVFFKSYPPRCNFLYVAQDRLWGLGQGAAGIEVRSPNESMRVYRTKKPNMLNSWLTEETQDVEPLDLSNKHGVVDNLEAIAQGGSNLVFIGREKTQVYTGLVADNTFSWHSTVSSGAIHGDLVFELANDIFFIDAGGLHSFSTLNIGNQFASSTITAINSLLKEQVVYALQSNVLYRSSFVFLYKLGAFLGIKIGDSVLNHALFSTQPNFFSLFSGDFESNHIVHLGNRLFILKNRSILVYGDGRDGSPKAYSDYGTDNKGLAIVGSWHQPFNQSNRELSTSYRVSCLADYANTFIEDSGNGVFVELFNERPKSTSFRKQALLTLRKEVLKGNIGDIEFNGEFKTLSRELKKRGADPWLFLSVISRGSYFSIKKVIFYGRRDR